MTCRGVAPAMLGLRAWTLLLCGVVLIQLLAAARVHAQRSKATSPWQTLSGDAPLVIARGGFSGLFPDSSSSAYSLAMMTSVSNVVLWCDVQLTKDGIGICFPDVKLDNASNVKNVYPKRQSSYPVNGDLTEGWFASDFTLKELGKVFLNQGIFSRTYRFDASGNQIMTVDDVATQFKPPGFWLNIQHDAFYSQHNLSMSKFALSVLRSGVANYISSPEVNFLRGIARSNPKVTKLVFRFREHDAVEPSTNQTYGSFLSNLTSIKAFASGILVPKSYIWPVDTSLYLLPHTSLVQDAHKAGLEVYASDFANDFVFAYNYSYDPVAEYLSFMDNRDFSVDGVLTDFPITASEAVDCFSHLGRNATKQMDVLVITKDGASGDYPGCTNLAYQKAITDGADIIDCPVQMSKDGVPFCLSSIELGSSTMIAQSPFLNRSTTVPEISARPGIYSFSLTWSEIQTLKPAISNPFSAYILYRNPKNKAAGNLISLVDFLSMAKNASSLTGVLISVENAAYFAQKQGLGMVHAVLGALKDAGYNNKTTQTVMIQSSNSSVLVEFKAKSSYKTVYKIEEAVRDVQISATDDIKKFADSVVVKKESVFPVSDQFILSQTDVVSKLQKSQLPVYVSTFHNEFVSQAWDFFSDATVEINSFVLGVGINGTVTDFPQTAARYRRNRCLGRKNIPPYMAAAKPGALLELVSPQSLPPAEAPNPVFTDADVTEPPLPPVTARAPTTSPGTSATRGAPPPSGQSRVASSLLSSTSAILLAYLILL